jgi:hypothetical protein
MPNRPNICMLKIDQHFEAFVLKVKSMIGYIFILFLRGRSKTKEILLIYQGACMNNVHTNSKERIKI